MAPAWIPASAPAVEPDKALAVGVGVLMGIITGVIFVLLLLQIASVAKTKRTRTITAAITQCLALPAFWFGGPWLTGRLVASSGLDAAVSYYTVALATVFLLIAGYPLTRLVLRAAEKLRTM